jgi:acetolactate synthase I/II/III large subunit
MRNGRHGGLLLVDLLLAHDVDTVFGLPGGQTMAVYDGIEQRAPRIRHVLVRDERTAAYAADGFARATGRVGVCDATVGPGAAKLPSGLGEALNASIPLLAIVSELPRAWRDRGYRGAASQALDQAALLAPVTKWLAEVPDLESLQPLTEQAFAEATGGRPGPVALIIPQDVLDEDWDGELVVDAELALRRGRFPAERPAPAADAVRDGAALLTAAERPFVVAGGGALTADAGAPLLALAERLDAAVATSLSGKGVIPENHPLAVGVVGTLGTTAAHALFDAADVVLLAGCKAGSGVTFGWKLPRPDQRVVHLDVDPAVAGREVPAAVAIVADAREGLAALAATVERQARPAWRARIDAEVGTWRQTKCRECASDAIPIAPQRVALELERVLGPDDHLVCDARLSSGWGGVYVEQPEPGRRILTPRGLAGLGWSLPAAIGVAVAAPETRTVVLCGDGGFAYAVGELATLVELGAPVTLVILNNSSLGWIRWYRRVAFGRGHEDADFGATNYAAVAAAYGLHAARVERPNDLAAALNAAVAVDGPALVEVISEVWETPIVAHREAVERSVSAGYGG